jgi:polyferredoxin
MPDTMQTTGRRERILRSVGRALLVTGIVLNVLALLPAIAASAWTGHWTRAWCSWSCPVLSGLLDFWA